jgi:hypothetical protein
MGGKPMSRVKAYGYINSSGTENDANEKQELTIRRYATVDVEHVRNLNDQILFRLGWIYDINFHPTLRRIREKRYVEMIRRSLPNSPEIDKIFHAVWSFMGRKLSEQSTGIRG